MGTNELLRIRSLGWIFTLVAWFGACAPGETAPLVGTWLLEGVQATSADGTVDDAPYGTDPSGYITYTSEGRMQVILSFSGRSLLSSDWRASPPEERAEAFATSLSYAGRYIIVGERVTHHVEVSSDPNRVGTSIRRIFSLQGDRLVLKTPPTSVGGSAREFTLTWRKADDVRPDGGAP
jgi:Lipocalin-like domain